MISVIIPIYNVLCFIDRGIQNVLKQTYQDFEIILSDDGSTDGSYEECQRWERKDHRIRALHQKNKGAGAARNHGLEEARGEFIYFFDIDDEIDPHLFEYCVGRMNALDVDFIVFGYNNVETTFNSRVPVRFPETVISTNAELRNFFVDQFVLKVNGFPWNKFYRKSFLDAYHLRYEDQRIQQDEVFNLMCYRHLEHAFLSPEILYTYYIYEKGNTRSRFIADRFDIYKSVRQHFEELKLFWNLSDKRLDDYLNRRFYDGVKQCLQFNLSHPDCIWSKVEKNKEMDRILTDPLTSESFVYADSNATNLEERLFRKACEKRNLTRIRLYSGFFGFLHSLRKKLR